MVIILCIEISYIKALGLYEFMRGLDGFVNWWVRVGVGVGGGIGEAYIQRAYKQRVYMS